jgi:hypothetical protein
VLFRSIIDAIQATLEAKAVVKQERSAMQTPAEMAAMDQGSTPVEGDQTQPMMTMDTGEGNLTTKTVG